MEGAQLVELLRTLSSNDNASRQKAETLYQQAKVAEPEKLILGMLGVLSAPEVGDALRRHVAVLMRNLCWRGGAQRDFIFAKISQGAKEQVANGLLARFEAETVSGIQRKIGDIIVALTEHVCCKEDPRGHLVPDSPNGWPSLLPFVFQVANPATNPRPESCESALRMMKDLSATILEDFVAAQQEMKIVLQSALSHAALKVRVAALLLVCDFVQNAEKRAWVPLLATLDVLLQVLGQLVQESENDNDDDWLLHELLKSLIDTAASEPDFFKVQLKQSMEPAQMLASIAKRKNLDVGARALSLEWIVSYTEKRAKWLTKNLPQLPALSMEVSMQLMLEIDEEDVEAWAMVMWDEEGEEDVDTLFHAGRDAIDRIMKSVSMDAFGQPLFQLIERFSMQQEWLARHAALSAIKQTAEYVEEKQHLDAMTNICLQSMTHQHPRVRYTALHAIGQIANDQSPHFQEAWHERLMPVWMTMMDDSVDRVASMAISAFVSFGEELDNSLMMSYVHSFMEKLVHKLQSTQHRGVREECITAIAVIAGVAEKEFVKYYDGIMPILKQLIVHAVGAKENRLRGKAFECISLLGLAVGKERFLPDAGQVIEAMSRPTQDADDVQREYIKEAMERIVECLQKDFVPFLPHLLPPLLQKLNLEEDDDEAAAYAGPEDYVQVCMGDADVVWVRSERLQQLQASLKLLYKIIYEVESAFFDYVPPAAKALLPLLSTADEMTSFCDEVRSGALVTWALLVKSSRLGAQERNQPPDMTRELLRTGLQNAFGVMNKMEDPDALAAMASGLAECMRSIGPGVLVSAEVMQLVDTLFKLIDASLQRSSKHLKEKEEYYALNGPDDEEGDDEDYVEKPEEQCRRNYEEVLGAIMQVAPQDFMQCLPACADRIGQWLQTKNNVVLGLYLASDLLKELRDRSESVWPVFMPTVFKALGDQTADPDAICAAAYCVNLAARLPQFGKAASEAFRLTGQVLVAPRPKKRDNKARISRDNAVASMLSLARWQAQHCPSDVNAWTLVLSNLPLREDEEEAKKVHDSLVDVVLEQNQALVSLNLGAVLGIFAEVYRSDDICTKETDQKIKKVFELLPRDTLQSLAASFSDKQRKKIEKMLLSA